MTTRHPRHHPSEELLLGHAAGSLPAPVALVVATHLALCPLCRGEIRRLEALGGVLLEDLAPEPVGAECRARTLALLDQPPPPRPPRPRASGPLPGPLALLAPDGLDRLAWRKLGPLAEADLLEGYPGFRTRLMRVRPGAAMPQHTHRGMELTLVLTGGFRDEDGHFRRGDLAEADAEVDHRPIADDDEECLCLAVTDAPLRLTGLFGRLLNPFLRH
jgi:putative transcriptional regulator